MESIFLTIPSSTVSTPATGIFSLGLVLYTILAVNKQIRSGCWEQAADAGSKSKGGYGKVKGESDSAAWSWWMDKKNFF